MPEAWQSFEQRLGRSDLVLFGPLAVVLGAPLVVVLYVFVKQLPVRDALGHSVEIPGEGKQEKENST